MLSCVPSGGLRTCGKAVSRSAPAAPAAARITGCPSGTVCLNSRSWATGRSGPPAANMSWAVKRWQRWISTPGWRRIWRLALLGMPPMAPSSRRIRDAGRKSGRISAFSLTNTRNTHKIDPLATLMGRKPGRPAQREPAAGVSRWGSLRYTGPGVFCLNPQ